MKPKLIKLIKERDAWCWHCGAEDGLQIHHRRNKGMGGSIKLDRADNLIRVCAWLNYQMEQNAEVASDARDHGWKLGSWDGFDTPVFDKPLGAWFMITSDGRKVPSGPPSFLI